MNEVKATSVCKPFIVMVCLVLILSACSSKANHLSKDLEQTGDSGQYFAQATQEAAQTVEAGSEQAQPTTPILQLTVTSDEQNPSATLNPILIGTPSPLAASSTAQTGAAQTATPTRTPTPSRTATGAPNATATPSKTATNTATWTPSPTAQAGWEGEWKILWQANNQSYVEGTLSILVVGTDLTGTGTWGGVNYSFTGRIIYDGETAFGNWTSSAGNGSFIWENVGIGQFGGSRDLDFGFCGAREGTKMPDVCYVPPLL